MRGNAADPMPAGNQLISTAYIRELCARYMARQLELCNRITQSSNYYVTAERLTSAQWRSDNAGARSRSCSHPDTATVNVTSAVSNSA